MDSVIYNPLEEYEKKFKGFHLEIAEKFFNELAERSGINIEENRATVREYEFRSQNLAAIKKKLNRLRAARVFMIISIVLIPLVILKTTPRIKELRSQAEDAGGKVEELLAEAQKQVQPLNNLFTDKDALKLIEETVPLLRFAPCFSAEQEADMRINYDYCTDDENNRSTLDVLSGQYNENPFIFENKFIKTMRNETYHGYKTISWTETYRDSDGKMKTRTRTETLHASVIKPKPFYATKVFLYYGSQGAPELSFSRDATHLELKSEDAIERYVKRGEKRLKKKTDRAIKGGDDFVSMSNYDFEVLFDALDRTDEVQYRTLFTPLAQTNMVDLIRSRSGYGDDFNFFKQKRMNVITTEHSQGGALNLCPSNYVSYSFDVIHNNFIEKNAEYFKSVYFDFAPIWAIPVYQERPVHSLKPIPPVSQMYSQKEYEVLANIIGKEDIAHPDTKTNVIIKSDFIGSKDGADEVRITAYSYNTIPRIDIIPVYGGDGRWHDVEVPWDEYIPLERQSNFFIGDTLSAKNRNVIASRNGLSIFN